MGYQPFSNISYNHWGPAITNSRNSIVPAANMADTDLGSERYSLFIQIERKRRADGNLQYRMTVITDRKLPSV